MARFVARHRNYTHGAVTGSDPHVDFQGKIKPGVDRVDAVFEYSLVSDDDFVAGASGLVFTGLPMWEGTEEEVSPRSRMSVWDSDDALSKGMRPDQVETVIDSLRNSTEINQDFIEVTPAGAAKPWPNYDSQEADDIANLVTHLGLDPVDVAKYEAQNQNRKSVLDALDAATEVEEGEGVVVNAG